MVQYPTIYLQPGQKGENVKKLQQYLVQQGYMTQAQMNTGPGIYGPRTKAAVAALQKKLGVNTAGYAGYWGPRTLKSLSSSVLNNQNQSNYLSGQGSVGQMGTWIDPVTGRGYSGPKQKETDIPASQTTGNPLTQPPAQPQQQEQSASPPPASPPPAQTTTSPPAKPSTTTTTTTGNTNTAGAWTTETEDAKAKRKQLAEETNKKAKELFDKLPKKTEIDMRKSQKLLREIKDEMDKTEKNIKAPTSLSDLFTSEKAKLGIDDLETKAANIDSQIETVKANLLTQADRAGEKLLSMTEIGRERSKLQREADRQIALLTVQKNAIQRQLANKLDTLKITMDLTSKDFQNTSDYYQKQYNREVSLYNLVKGEENLALSHEEKARDDARANLTVLQNAMKDNKISYDDLNVDQKLKIFSLEQQAGLPVGFLSQLSETNPNAKVQTVSTRTDSNGNTYFDVLLKEADGSLKVKSIFKGKAEQTAKGESTAKKVYEEGGGQAAWGMSFTDWYKDVYKKTKTEEVTSDSSIAKDLKDSATAISQGADTMKVRQRFLDRHPDEANRFDRYMGLK